MTFSLILAFSAFLFSLLGTRLAILAARSRTGPPSVAMLKKRLARVPGGGGIVPVFTIAMALVIADSGYGVIFGMLLLAGIALLGQLLPLPAFVKLSVQLLAVAVALGGLPHGLFSALPPQLDKIATAVLWIWLMACFRRYDGMDGLCASQITALGASLVFLLAMIGRFPGTLAELALSMGAAAIGFAWWNWPPARIRMGEPGTLPLGFLYGYALLLLAQQGQTAAALILPAYVLSDASLTWLRGLRSPGAMLYYQRRISHAAAPATLRYVAGLHLLLGFLAVFAALQPAIAALPLALAYFAVFMMLGFFAYERH